MDYRRVISLFKRNVAGIRCSEIPPLVLLQHGGRWSSSMAVAVVIRVVLTLFNTISPCFDQKKFPEVIFS